MNDAFKFLITFMLLTFFSCGKGQMPKYIPPNPSGTPSARTKSVAVGSSTSEGALAALGSIVGASEAGDELTKMASTNCSLSIARSSGCKGTNVMRTIWNGCYVGTLQLVGTWMEIFDSAATCATVYNGGGNPGELPSSGGLLRTTTGSVATFEDGSTTTTDTYNSGGSTYDNQSIAKGGISILRTSLNRVVSISGLHQLAISATGVKLFDHTLLTTTPGVAVKGDRPSGTRMINGTVMVYQNLIRYKAQALFNNVTWGNPLCCYPTSGTITSVLTGNRTGSLTMEFSPGATTCGQAKFVDADGTVGLISLTHCQE